MPVPPQVPVVHFQSPAFDDLMLVEAWNTELASYIQLPYGTPHPNVEKWSGYILVKQEALPGDEKWVMRYWVADEAVANTYNLARHNFDGEDIVKDIYVRNYMVRRVDYVPAAKKSWLTGVIAVRMTNQGTTYDSTATVAFTGGGGAGATGRPIVFRGAIVGVYMTAEGTGYTSAPSATFSAPVGLGTTALGTAVLPRATAILVEEQAERMPEAPDDGIYLKVTRVYHVLPGAELVSYTGAAGGKLKRTRRQKVALPAYPTATGYSLIGQKIEALSTVMGWQITEDFTNADGTTTGTPVPFLTHRETIEPEGVEMITWVKTVDSNTLPPAMGATSIVTADETISLASGAGGRRRIPTFPSGIANAGEWESTQGYVVHAERRTIEDSPNFTLIVQTCPIPRTRYEFPEVSFQFPALLTFNSVTSAVSLFLVGGRLPLRLDRNVNYTGLRTRRVVGCLLRKYSLGPTAALSPQWYLNSPGSGSAYFGQINDNTIYADLGAGKTEVTVYQGAVIIEQFPFSTVAGCAQAANSTPGTDLTPANGTLPVFYRAKVEQIVWKGPLYVREYLCLAEDRDIVADATALRFNTANDASPSSTTQYLWCA